MKRVHVVFALGSVVTATLLGVVSCGESNTTTPPTAVDSGVGSPDTFKPGTETAPGDDTSITPGEGGPTDTGGGGFEAGPPACPSDAKTKTGKLVDLLTPGASHVKINDGVKLTGAVVTSPKFLVSKSKAGTCLWGVFVADPNATFVAYSGVMVVSRGPNAVAFDSGATSCPRGGDLIPEDAKPGDIVNLHGLYDEFGPTAATCGAATPPVPPPNPGKMPQIESICAYTKTGTGTAPAPAEVPPADLATGTELPKWIGGLVRVKNVEAATATMPGDTSFGVFKLKGSNLPVSNTMYFRGAATSPTIKVGDKFDQITGMSYLDFCSWSLIPRTICDHTPVPPPGDAAKCAGGSGGDAATD